MRGCPRLDSIPTSTEPIRCAERKRRYLPTDKNLRAIQLLLGHTNLESTVRYLGIEIDDALESQSRQRFKEQPTGGSPAVTNRPGADLHLCVYLARFQTISSTPAGAFGLMNRISSAVIDVTTRL